MKNDPQYEALTPAEVLRAYADGRRDFTHVELPEGESLKSVTLAGAVFDRGWIPAIDFSGADLREASFDGSHVKLCRFAGADLTGASFRGAGIDGATFEKARIDQAVFTGATAYGITLSDGETPWA